MIVVLGPAGPASAFFSQKGGIASQPRPFCLVTLSLALAILAGARLALAAAAGVDLGGLDLLFGEVGYGNHAFSPLIAYWRISM